MTDRIEIDFNMRNIRGKKHDLKIDMEGGSNEGLTEGRGASLQKFWATRVWKKWPEKFQMYAETRVIPE